MAENIFRMCEITGYKVGEQFTVAGDTRYWYINSEGRVVNYQGKECPSQVLCNMINYPETVRKYKPLFTKDELDRCRVFGARYISRDTGTNRVKLWVTEPMYEIGTGTFKSSEACLISADATFFPSILPGEHFDLTLIEADIA